MQIITHLVMLKPIWYLYLCYEYLVFSWHRLTYDYGRLFRTTGALVLLTRVAVRLISCSEDIIHSWAVSGLGIKIDCVPGKLFCILTHILGEG